MFLYLEKRFMMPKWDVVIMIHNVTTICLNCKILNGNLQSENWGNNKPWGCSSVLGTHIAVITCFLVLKLILIESDLTRNPVMTIPVCYLSEEKNLFGQTYLWIHNSFMSVPACILLDWVCLFFFHLFFFFFLFGIIPLFAILLFTKRCFIWHKGLRLLSVIKWSPISELNRLITD